MMDSIKYIIRTIGTDSYTKEKETTVGVPFRSRPSVQCTVIVHREHMHGERRGIVTER